MKTPLLLLLSVLGSGICAGKELFFRGACDASAAVALDDGSIVVADDESNTLRIFRPEDGAEDAISSFALDKDLGVEGSKNPEADIEGATRVGDTIYWITSHGRSRKGKWRDARFFLFATNAEAPLKVKGRPYKRMIHSLVRLPGLDLQKAIGELGEDEVAGFAPKESGLNIESLSASADGKILYLGFRNPQPAERAILLPLLNVADVTAGTGMAPVFGEALLLDLRGLGFRAMEYSTFHKSFFIVAGSHDSGGTSVLYRWSGEATSQPEKIRALADSNAESIVPFPDKQEILLISDDGTKMVSAKPGESTDEIVNGQCECKSLVDPKAKYFRASWVDPK